MKKINHTVLIVSIAAAVVVAGAAIALGLYFGVWIGLLSALGAFTVLIACMLFADRQMSKQKDKKDKKKPEKESEKGSD